MRTSAFPAGHPCWIDLVTDDLPAALDFYTTLFGWTATDQGPDFGHYHRITAAADNEIAGAMAKAEGHDVPNLWTVYLATADAAATQDAAVAAGASVYAPAMEVMESAGVPMMDGAVSMPLEHGENHIEVAKKLFDEVPIGITHFILHPSIDTPELRAICPDWEARVANYNAFMSAELKKFLESAGIKLIGYRAIRDAMRS